MAALNSVQSTHQRSALPTLNHTRSVLQKLHEDADRQVPPAAVVTLSPQASRDWQRDPQVSPSPEAQDAAARESSDTTETPDTASTEGPQARAPGSDSKPAESKARASIDGLTQDQRDMVTELVQRDREVHTHEAAHQAAGGGLVGNASYTYQEGPDGRAYAIGGECPITIPASDNPSERIAIAQRVRSAALAPANPSGADMAVANAASQMEMQARQQLAQQQAQQQQAPAAPSAGQSAPPAEEKGETPPAEANDQKGETPSGRSPSTATPASTAIRAMAAYAQNAPAQARVPQSSGL